MIPLLILGTVGTTGLLLFVLWRQKTSRLRKTFEEMEGEVSKRNVELLAANDALRSFNYSVAHEMRAPLSAIEGFGKAIEEDAGQRLEPKTLEYLREMRAAAVRMAHLLDRLLDLGHAMQAPLQVQSVDATALVRTIAEELRRLEPNRSVECVVQEGLRARGDPQLLALVFRNLLQNAWKFTAGKPEAQVEVGGRELGREQLFYVRDNGAGFDPRYLNDLFADFSRLHLESEFGGTGIGLATARRIVERHEGRIWAEGAIGQGATFTFTLP